MQLRTLFLPVVLLLVVGASSCQKSDPMGVAPGEPFEHTVFGGRADSPGAFHNDIVEAYARLRPFDSHRPLNRDEFIRHMVEASNEALAARGLSTAVRVREIEHLLGIVAELRRLDVYDILAPERSDPRRIVDHLEAKGAITRRDAGELRRVVAAVRSGTVELTALFPANSPPSETLAIFEDVYRASNELWRSGRLRRLTGENGGFNLLSREGDGILMDSIGIVFGTFLGGWVGGVIGGAFFSIMFYEEPPAGPGEGWNCTDWCDAA